MKLYIILSRLNLIADLVKYKDTQAISNVASVIQSKSLAEEAKQFENDDGMYHQIINQYRKFESNNQANNDLITNCSNT